ncbi:hypothetical protein ACOMCU_24435 [Lysinibacillus sp. UGB7]|uniref:hypothetical protein n=1 Tax=Lysinibacillus sp. UGB7 TaxID=3411039 RepID=UPI003B7AE522
MNDTQPKPRLLTSFLPMFKEIRNNYGIDILEYDSLDEFIIAFLSLNNEQQFNATYIPSEWVYVNEVVEKMRIAQTTIHNDM